MKRLLLVRHAKSSWNNPDQRDIDRPLNHRGERDAPEMGRRLAKAGLQADELISSPAVRAMMTARRIAESLGMGEGQIRQVKEMYEAGLGELFGVLQGVDDTHESVILIGHNPGLTVLNYCLSGYPINNIPTCGMVHVELAVGSWSEVEEGGATFLFYDYPKNHTGSPITE